MEELGKLYIANQQWKEEIKGEMGKWKNEMKQDMQSWKQEIIHEFHVVAEDIRHDALGANRDKVGVLSDRSEKHEKRIVKLEHHTGLIAA